jgi:hypothetical protein
MLSFLTFRRRNATSKKFKTGLLGFRIAPDAKASLHSQGIVLINLTRGTVFAANRAGAIIWTGAVERWSLDRIAKSISSEFHIPAQAAHDDTAEFVAQLAAEGFLIPEAS